MSSRRSRLLHRLMAWVEPADNPNAFVYGTVAAGLVIAAEEPATETYGTVVSATVVAAVLYWLAHAYAATLGERYRSRRAPTWRTVPAALRHEGAIAAGAIAPTVVLFVDWLVGATLQTAVSTALWATVVVLFVFEIAAGLRAKLPGWQLAGSALVGAALGAALVGLKAILH